MKLLSPGLVPLILLLVVPMAHGSTLQPFTSDGCSMFVDGTTFERTLWLSCCTEHDRSYWQGGTEEQRQQADQQLADCVTRVGAPTIAQIMLAGVRFGGSPYFPTSYRWGYGWSYLRGYKALSPKEQGMVEQMLLDQGEAPHQ